MPEYQGENFKFFLEKNGVSVDKATQMLNKKSRQSVYKYFASKNLSREVVDNITKTFNVSLDDIWNDDIKGRSPKLEAKPLRLADPYGFDSNGGKIYELPDGSLAMNVPVIPVKAYGSYLRGYPDPEFYEGLETIPVPVEVAHKGTYLIFEVDGVSMVNIENEEMARKSIWPKQKVVGRELIREHWKYKLHISKVDAWVIVHKFEGIVVKEISDHDVDAGTITLHSWNPDKDTYPDFTVSLDEVEQIFNVVDPFNKRLIY